MKCEMNPNNCPIEVTLSLIGGKYKPVILWFLIERPLHYAQLQRLIPKATPKMLSQQLHDLENCGIIHREVIPEKPPKTLYSLTAFGRSLIPILDAMCEWGKQLSGWTGCAIAVLSRTKIESWVWPVKMAMPSLYSVLNL